MGLPAAQPSVSLYAQLRTAVLNGEYSPGTVLVEAAVAETYGVSRTPVREALRALEKDGILQQHGRHLMVRITTFEEVLEVYDCRIVLEGVAAGWAARTRSESDLVLLDLALGEMRSASGSAPSSLSSVNHLFHERLWRASHNATLVDLLTRLELHIRRYPEPTVSQPGRWEEAITEHTAILQAIRDRDEKRAEEASRNHMVAARELRLKMVMRTQAGS
jgi:DNA-binding GntR family transcriptional regulator